MAEQIIDTVLKESSNAGMLQIYFSQLDTIIADSNLYINQLTKFITDIHGVQIKYNVSVVNILGNLSVDVPVNMSETIEAEVVKKVSILDRLCIQRCTDIETELSKGRDIENLIRKINPGYTSRISGQIAEFARLSGAFK